MIDDPTLRLGFAFSAGLATFFAPCAYPMLPGYLAFYLGDAGTDGQPSRRGALRRALLVAATASVGFFLVYALLAGVVAALGTRVLGSLSLLGLGVGVVLVGGGVAMATGLLPTSALHVRLPRRRRSIGGYLLFGVLYAVAAAGCTAPIFVAIAGIALGSGPVGAVATFGAYASGMAILLVGVTALVALGKDSILQRVGTQTGRVRRTAGALMIVAGLAQLYLYLFEFGALTRLGV
jgi:cytochrome c-type biogenesis protein